MNNLLNFIDEPPKIERGKLLDHRCKYLINKNINMMVPWWLMACYAYYHLDTIILSDNYFEFELSKQLKENFKNIEHRHKNIIENHLKEMIGNDGIISFKTAFMIPKQEYPNIIIGATIDLIKQIHG